jgi:hypothetical protein
LSDTFLKCTDYRHPQLYLQLYLSHIFREDMSCIQVLLAQTTALQGTAKMLSDDTVFKTTY